MNYPYYLKIKNKEGRTILTLNAKDIEDIYRQAHNFVNEIPNSIIMTNNSNKIFILLSPDINTIASNTKKNTSIGTISNSRYIQNNNIQDNKHKSRNFYQNNAYNAFNAFDKNNAYNTYYTYNLYLHQANNICQCIIKRNITMDTTN